MLAAGTSQAIGKRLSRRLNGTSVAPEFTPKRNSELSDNRGRRPTTRCVSSLATSTSLVKARLTPAFVLARVWADRDGVAAYVLRT